MTEGAEMNARSNYRVLSDLNYVQQCELRPKLNNEFLRHKEEVPSQDLRAEMSAPTEKSHSSSRLLPDAIQRIWSECQLNDVSRYAFQLYSDVNTQS